MLPKVNGPTRMSGWSFYKFATVFLLIMLLLGAAILFYYESLHKRVWEDENKAIQAAYRETDMVDANRVETFAYQDPYRIVFGKDAENLNMIVWVGEEEIHAEYAADGVNKNLLKLRLLEAKPDADIIRITPGKYNDEWAWEVYYTRPWNNDERTFYDFYRFSDGELMETLTLSINH
jgi:uncharacterized protein YpmB